jgi:hypothetical protein
MMRPVSNVWGTMGGIAVAVAIAGFGTPATLVAQDRPAAAQAVEEPAIPAADPADVESIDAIMTAIYDVISGGAGEARDWDRFRSLHIKEARLIPSGRRPDNSHGYVVWSPDEYIERAGSSLEANGFFETEAHRVTERWADIAHVFSTYNSYRTAADMEADNHFQRGINSFQLMYDGSRWWIVTIMWEGETPDQPIAEEYLDGA